MASRLRRAGGDLLISIGVLGAVVAVLVSVDPRVREQLQAVGSVLSLDGLGVLGRRLQDVGLTLFEAVRTQSIEHAPFMIFAVVALVLLFAMMRS
jgi:hypothetical protein